MKLVINCREHDETEGGGAGKREKERKRASERARERGWKVALLGFDPIVAEIEVRQRSALCQYVIKIKS